MNPERLDKHPPEDDLRLPPEILHALAKCQPEPGKVPPEIDATILKAARVRMAEIREASCPRPVARFLWPLATAACLMLAFLLRPQGSGDHTQPPSVEQKEDAAAIILREFSALYPNQVRAITQDSQGIHLSLADRPGLVSGQALVLKICQATGCKEIITFSGQDIEVAGQAVTVRTDKGRIILDGEQFIWASDHHGNPAPNIHIESRWL